MRFAPPIWRIGCDRVAAVPDEMCRHFNRVARVPRLRQEGRQRKLMLNSCDASQTRNTASTFPARHGYCVSLVNVTATTTTGPRAFRPRSNNSRALDGRQLRPVNGLAVHAAKLCWLQRGERKALGS